MLEPENTNQNRKKRTLPEAAKPHQFKPGQSGNPGGRPKKKPLTEALERILNHPDEADAIAKALTKAARKGNVQAAREIADRIEGKVGERMEVSGGVTYVSFIARPDRDRAR